MHQRHVRGWWWLVVLFAIEMARASDFEQEFRVLRKQVKALLDRRKEDVESIEDSLRSKLSITPEIALLKDEIHKLRSEIDQLKGGVTQEQEEPEPHRHLTQEKNDRLTLKWLTNNIQELKTEVGEFQTTLNTTAILQNREQVDSELSLLKTDVFNLNKELESAKTKNVKYEAELVEMREEVGSLRDHARATAVICGKTKNQLKTLQIEWNYNWKKSEENKLSSVPLSSDDGTGHHQSRHQRLLRKHVVDLEKTAKHLKQSNGELQTKMLKVEEEMRILQNNRNTNNEIERIAGNEIDEFIKRHHINEIKPEVHQSTLDFEQRLYKLEEEQRSGIETTFNFSKQFANFDKLHMSMLELLENVESIENKVDTTFPEFRKEISKLEFQMSESLAEIALLKEDQTNTRESVKAISVTTSNLKDKMEMDHLQLAEINNIVRNLKTSSNMQTSKLHDHILKAESSTIDLNSTKSAIHLVQELKSFEKEYKSIVNKLPHDCSAVSGPNGVYLISPGDGEPIMANCQDGWTAIQKRYDGSVDFNRNWNEYSNGFGSANGEHWLGNRNIHYLTKSNCTRLRINMKDIYGKYWEAAYDDFRVSDYTCGFKMSVGGYRGNASDAMDYQNHMEFSTIDNDRDISNTHCASNYEGGWWFSHCQHANLNGRYNLGLTWFDSSRNEWIAVASSEMRVKKHDLC